MKGSLARMIFDALSARPILTLTVVSLGATFVSAAINERQRLLRVMRETTAELDERAEQVEARIARGAAEEFAADFDPERWTAGGEIAARLGMR